LIKQFTAYRVRAINFIFFLRKEGIPRVLRASQDSIQQVLEVLSTPLKALGLLKLKQKVLALASVLLLAGSGYFLWLSLIKQKVLIKDPPLFWARFSDLGDEIPLKQEQVGDLQEFSMSFYDNSLVQRYQFLVEKLVINLEPSDFSSRLPMVAMELILESFDPLVLARIKAKESFFREIIQAETASFSFEIIESAEGKKELLRRIREALNRQLGERAIVAVYFKTIVVKP
jgi:flagellar basal body-associated protein FliL